MHVDLRIGEVQVVLFELFVHLFIEIVVDPPVVFGGSPGAHGYLDGTVGQAAQRYERSRSVQHPFVGSKELQYHSSSRIEIVTVGNTYCPVDPATPLLGVVV